MNRWPAVPLTVEVAGLQLRTALRDLGPLLMFFFLLPLGILFFLGSLVGSLASQRQILVGSILLETALVNITSTAEQMAQDKQSRMYDLWVSTPVSPLVYLLSISLTNLPLTLVSAASLLLAAEALFGIGLSALALAGVFASLLLVFTSTLGIGFLIGAYGRSPRATNTLANFAGAMLGFFAPVYYPVTILPLPWRYLAYGWPLTWGSVLLDDVISGTGGAALLPVGVLAGFSLLWVVWVGKVLRWRER